MYSGIHHNVTRLQRHNKAASGMYIYTVCCVQAGIVNVVVLLGQLSVVVCAMALVAGVVNAC